MKNINLDFNTVINDIMIKEDTLIRGIYKGTGKSIIDQEFNINFAQPNLKSNIIIKAVLFNQDVFKIRPNIIINKGNKGVETFLKIDILLIGDSIISEITPSLEIKENEVNAGHGVTIGKLNPEHLFYITSRGLNLEKAQEILIKAFLLS